MSVRLLLALWVCGLAACGRPRSAASAEPPRPQVRLHGVRIRYYQGDALVAQSRAAHVTFQRESTDLSASDAFVRFSGQGALSGRSGNVEVHATRVEGNLSARQADGLDGVTLKTGSGLQGETQRAHFDGATQRAHGDEPVSVWGPGYWLDAKGFRFQLADEQLEFVDGVESRLGAAE
jgi:lipopolysaccharide export system protein LptC